MSEWQPIETAPKDGTIIDLLMVDDTGEKWRECNCFWANNYQIDYFNRSKGNKSGWIAISNDYESMHEWVEIDKHAIGDGTVVFVHATHWMPLPEPPK